MLAAALVLALLPTDVRPVDAARRPDIIVIVTDDQRWDTMGYMPLTRQWLPTSYANAFVSNATCCPSRTSIFTGLYSHDNGVWTNGGGEGTSTRAVYGGWPRYAVLGLDVLSTPYLLQETGYRTGHFGKFLNRFEIGSLGEVPAGWDEFAATGPKHGPGAPFYNYTLQGRHEGAYLEERHDDAPKDFSTSVLRDHALGFLASSDDPIFLHLAFNAPHSSGGEPPIPAPEDVGATVELPPLAPNVNVAAGSDKPRYIQDRPEIPTEYLDHWRREVARSLYAVDRSIDALLTAQEARDPGLANTLVVFLSDNGFMTGAHRWLSKSVPYEESIRIPMLARHPTLPPGEITSMAANIDVAATVADVAGIEIDAPDSVSLLDGTRRFVVLESAGGAKAHCGIRTSTRKYVRYATGEVEFYRLTKDPFELRNRPDAKAVDRLYRRAARVCSPLPADWPRETL